MLPVNNRERPFKFRSTDWPSALSPLPWNKMGALDIAFGTGLIGSWLASLLCGVGYSQAIRYYNAFPEDSVIRKSLVAATIFFTLVELVGAYADVYMATVTFWGNPAGLSTETWSVPVYSSANAMLAITVNGYLISRYYAISKNVFVALILCAIALFAFIMAFLAVFLYPGDDPNRFPKAKKVSLIWAISCAVSDVSIAASLVLTLRRMKTNFKSTKRLVRRVIIICIQNGCATSLAAIAGMIAFIFKIDSNIPTVFFFLLGPLYLLTLLSNLNVRESARSGSRTLSSSRNTLNTSIVIDGVYINRTNMNPMTLEIEMDHRNQVDSEGSLNPKSAPDTEAFGEGQVDLRSGTAKSLRD
ncbi:hypothetical protein B0H12DRAFT_724104 [Mycena haematopus]|nr:hypothetical protein B0H12DRAFT_724104 [Mycena haematopus]